MIPFQYMFGVASRAFSPFAEDYLGSGLSAGASSLLAA